MAKAKKPAPDAEAAAAIERGAARPQELAERLADPDFRERIEEAIAALPPDKAAELVALLEASIRRRKIELLGYIGAAVVLLIGMVIAIYAYGAAADGVFVGWVFMIPLALAGLVMIVVARMAKRAEAAEAAARRKAAPPAGPGV